MNRREQLIKDLARHIVKRNKENFDDMNEEPKDVECFSVYGVTHDTCEQYMKELLNEVVDEVEKEQRYVAEFLYEW